MRPIITNALLNTRSLWTIFVIAFAWLSLNSPFAFAQSHTAISETTGIGKLGTVVTPDGTTFKITGGTRSDEGRGTNLFHSFDQFSVGPGDVAKFLNTTPAPHTENIVSRVTGQSPSSIFGTIDTTNYPGANLFLMNPAGIIFGPTAKLDIGGSVTFTTANYLRLAGAAGSSSGIFYADVTRANVLTSASIAAFGFLEANPTSISLQGSTLKTTPGKSISLVGGDTGFSYANGTVPDGLVLTNGHLSTAGGKINIASVGSEGEILAGTLAQSLNINGQSFQPLGSVHLLQQSSIDARGDEGGTIRIQSGQLIIDNSTVSSHAGAVSLNASSVQIMGSSRITTEATAIPNAGRITVNATGPISLDSSLVASAAGGGSGRAGDISFVTGHGNVALTGRSFITTQANSTGGGAGAIQIEAKQGDVLIESGSQILNFTEGGPLGSILIAAKNLHMSQAAILENNLSTQPAGNLVIKLTDDLSMISNSLIQTGTPANANAAGLFITARDILIADKSALFTGTIGAGSGGVIDLSARSLTIQNESKISADTSGTASSAIGGPIIVNTIDHVTLTNGGSITASTNGPGNAGNILVKAKDIAISGGSSIMASSTGTGNAGTVIIQGLQSPANSFFIDGSNSGISTKTSNTGAGGDIMVSANTVRMQNKSSISGETSGPTSTATGGNILVEGSTIRIENGALVTSASTGAGSGGNIKLTAEHSVSISDSASISANGTGTGAAGNVEINAGLELDVQRGSITTQSNQLNGGNVSIQAIDLIRVVEGKISTSSLNGGGNGGNITIDPKVVLLQNSEVLAQAKDGNGGSINISTPLYLKDQSSLVNADSQFGVNGTVTIQSPISSLSGSVGQLVSKTSPPQVLLQNRCIALAGGEQSTFILTGRDALPGEPSGWLSSPVTMEHWTGEDTAHAAQHIVRNQTFNSSPVIAARQNKLQMLSLRRLTPPGFLVRTFATEATGCPS